ncbi:MAG: DUF998 domain-containing protein [Anaerolineales bacterium]|nr:DUF998 domain-containing protein [Anaerolineales bacterium]
MKRLILLGPILFATVLTTLTIVQYDFMLGIGWHPIKDPTYDWPSGLALGPYGIVMTITFIISGLLMFLFALRLKADLKPFDQTQDKPARASQIGSAFLACSGLALAALAFTTDPTLAGGPRTWHGYMHDLSFVVLGITLLPAMLMLGKAFQADPRWRGYGIYTWLTAAFAIPSFFLKGAAFYVFLFFILLWNEIIALKLNSHKE